MRHRRTPSELRLTGGYLWPTSGCPQTKTKTKTEDGDEDGDGETDSPSNLQGGILGHYSSQELLDLRGSFPLLDLEVEAERCVDWYKSKGNSIRDARAVFRKWLSGPARLTERFRSPRPSIPVRPGLRRRGTGASDAFTGR